MRKVCIIGAGMIASGAHIPAYRNHPEEYEILGVCDVNAGAAKYCAEKNGIPHFFTDAREMLERIRPDIVSVCVPNVFHKPYVLLCAEYGAHILCEKPLALCRADAEEMFGAAKRAGVLLVACQSMRFTDDRLCAKKLIDEGALGNIYYSEFSRIRRRGTPMWGAFLKKELNGGGAFLDIGVHMLDAVVWLTGNKKPLSVVGSMGKYLAHDTLESSLTDSGALTGKLYGSAASDREKMDVEDFASGSILFEGGLRCNFKTAWSANLPDETAITLCGDKAGLSLPELRVYGGFAGLKADILPQCGIVNPYRDHPFFGHMRLVDHLTGVLRGECELMIRPEETVNVSDIIGKFYAM